jgi:hypothetical protein
MKPTTMNLSDRLAAAAQHSKAQIAAAPIQAPVAVWPPVKPRAVKPPKVQFLVRLTVEARAAIHAEAMKQGITETDLIERYALSLTQ